MSKWEIVSVKVLVNNLDNKRVPLNSSQRELKESKPLYPYIGANNIMGYIDEYIFDEKILCVAEDGGSWGYNQRCAVLYNEKVWVNNHAHVLTAKKNLVLEYLMYYLNHKDLNLYINGATRGKLTKSSLESIQIPLPLLSQQQKIANILDAADELRQNDKALIAKYDELTKALFLDMFGDPVSNPKGWEKAFLKTVSTKITDGTHFSPEPQTEGFPYITAKHVKNYGLDFYSKPTYISEEAHNEIYKRCTPEYGDVLYIKDGATTGIACINTFDEPFSMLSSLALIKPNKKILNSYYLCYWLNNSKIKSKLLTEFMSGAAIQRYTLTKINSFQLVVPPLDLQTQFAERVALIEEQKTIAQASLIKSEELFNSLLQKAFKGELV